MKILKPRKYIVGIYFLIGLITIILLITFVLKLAPNSQNYQPVYLLSDNFSTYKPGEIVADSKTWEYFLNTDDNLSKGRWYFTVNHFYHESNFPAEYSND